MKNSAHILFFFMALGRLGAQDLHLSQYNEMHSLLNPALTGATDPLRASVIYREQWRSVSVPFITTGLCFETRMNSNGWESAGKNQSMTFRQRSVGRLAWGVSVFNDRAGTGKLATTQANLSLATFIPVNEKSFFSIGLQGNFTQRNIENGRLIFPSQFNGYGYDVTMQQNERISSLSYNYFNFAGGASYSYGHEQKRIANQGQLKGNAGVAFYRIGSSREGFYDQVSPLQLKWVAHGDLFIEGAESSIAFAPSFMIQQTGNSREVILGTMIKHYLSDNSHYTGNVKRSCLSYGLYYRSVDAVIAALAFELKEQYAITMSYDINASQLYSVTTGKGAFELSLRYTPPKAFLYQKKGRAE